MPTLALLSLLVMNGLPPQKPDAVQQHMQALSKDIADLRRAVLSGDRTAIANTASALDRAARGTTIGANCTNPDLAAEMWLQIAAAATDLQHPVGNGLHSDPHDLHRLERACTTCHMHNRDRNAERGLFPNRANLVFGRVAVRERDGKLRADASGVVAFLESPDLRTEPLPRSPTIAQSQRRFEPSVLVVTPGTEVAFPNVDAVFHNVFSLAKGNAFDLGTYGNGQTRTRRLDQPGLVRVHCNIHPDMSAQILVLGTPLSSISDRRGAWCIPEVPDGSYTLRIWQALADEQRLAIEVNGGTAREVKIEVQETRSRSKHLDKNGRAYRDEY
jgi:plastocyanin